MGDNWHTVKLEEIIEINHGFGFKGEFFSNEPTPNVLLTPGNFSIGGGFKDDKFKFYDGPIDEKFILHADDLIITMTDLSKSSDTLGFPALIPPSNKFQYLHNQRLGKVIIKDTNTVDKKFLYYQLKNNNYRWQVIASATGTTVKHTSPSRILDISVLLPPLPTQRRIAHILGSLDDKIVLNRRMNATLEAIARAIFKSWFVDFYSVRAKLDGRDTGLPAEIAALFPDGFEESDLGKIPRGWRVGKLGDISRNVHISISPEELATDTPYISLSEMPQESISLFSWALANEVKSNKYKFKKNDILFGKLRPYFHKVGIAPLAGVCSTDILVIEPKEECWFGLSVLYLSSQELIQYVTAASTGTKMPRTNWQDIANYQIPIPPVNLAQHFSNLMRPIFGKIVNHIHQNQAIEKFRNALLPKLMSGDFFEI